MRYNALFLFVFLLVVVPLSVHADYNIYNQYGDDNGHGQYIRTSNAQTNFSTVSIPNTNNGSMTQPILQDINGDGVSDLFMGNGNNVYVLNGEDGISIEATFPIGSLSINPVICDINNDGILDYVAIADNGTVGFDYLWVIDLDSSNSPVIKGVPVKMNITNPRGNIACGQFYQKTGDGNNYIMFLDDAKRLYIMRQTGSSWVGNNMNLQELLQPSATVEESNYGIGTGAQPLGSHQVAYSNTFDPSGYGSVLFVAGRYAYVYLADGTTLQTNVNTSLNASYNPSSFGEVKIYGDVHTSPTGSTSALLLYDGSTGNAKANSLIKLSVTGSHAFLSRALQVDDVMNDLRVTDGSPGNTFPKFSALSVVPRSSGNGRDYLYILTNQEQNNPSKEAPFLRVLYAENFSTAFTQDYAFASFYNSLAGIGSATAIDGFMTLTTADFNKDGQIDILFSSGANEELCIDYPPFGASAPGAQCLVNISSSGVSYGAPSLYNSGGNLHLAYTAGSKSAWLSGFSISGLGGQQFNITQAGVTSNTSLDVIRVADDTGLFTYNYGLVCDIGDRTIFNDVFTFGYNFTTHNVSTPVGMPEAFLTSTGVRFTYTNTSPDFYLFKHGNQAYRQTISTRTPYQYTTSGDSVVDLFWFSSEGSVTYALEINRTGTNYQFYRIDFGGGLTNLVNQTITNGIVDLHVIFTPQTNPLTLQDYFNVDIQLGNASIANDFTPTFIGTNIQNIQWFTNQEFSPNQTITVNSIGFFVENDLFPALLQFSNPTQLTTIQPAQNIIQGDGFQVLTVSNNTFGSYCFYPNPGTFVQRHYLGALNNETDYSNYRDFTVTVVATGGTPAINESTSVTAGDGTDDVFTGVLPSFLFSLGFKTQASQTALWLLLSLIIGLFFIVKNTIGGILTFIVLLIVGVLATVVSFWVVVVFIILCAGLAGLFFRYMLGGS